MRRAFSRKRSDRVSEARFFYSHLRPQRLTADEKHRAKNGFRLYRISLNPFRGAIQRLSATISKSQLSSRDPFVSFHRANWDTSWVECNVAWRRDIVSARAELSFLLVRSLFNFSNKARINPIISSFHVPLAIAGIVRSSHHVWYPLRVHICNLRPEADYAMINVDR